MVNLVCFRLKNNLKIKECRLFLLENYGEFYRVKQYKQLIMRKLNKRKLTLIEKGLLRELAKTQEVKMGIQKHENLGFSDMPLFTVIVPELF